jgi:23S rRNA (pseudouridine1915-N3)-methyltransferase
MKIILILNGKTNQEHIQILLQDYFNRISHYINFEVITIPELKKASSLSFEEQKTKEGEQMMKYFETSDEIMLLDENGKSYNSVGFSKFIEKKMNASVKRMIFVVGGPFGFSQEIYKRANGMVSLSPMTFSHQVIRLIFAEQLYRAFTIIKGEKYHHV